MRDAGARVIALELEGEGGRGGGGGGGGGDDDDDDDARTRGGARPSRDETAAAEDDDAADEDAGPLVADLTGRGDCFPANKMSPNECLPMYSGDADGVVILDALARRRDATFAVLQLARVVRDGGWMQTAAPCRAGGFGGGGGTRWRTRATTSARRWRRRGNSSASTGGRRWEASTTPRWRDTGCHPRAWISTSSASAWIIDERRRARPMIGSPSSCANNERLGVRVIRKKT